MVGKVHTMKPTTQQKSSQDNGHDKDPGNDKKGNKNKLIVTLPNLTSVIHDFARWWGQWLKRFMQRQQTGQ